MNSPGYVVNHSSWWFNIFIEHGLKWPSFLACASVVNNQTSFQQIPHGGCSLGKVKNDVEETQVLIGFGSPSLVPPVCFHLSHSYQGDHFQWQERLLKMVDPMKLVGGWALPSWKIWVRQLGILFPIYGKHVWNHQPGKNTSAPFHN